jgi:hypothetical protein
MATNVSLTPSKHVADENSRVTAPASVTCCSRPPDEMLWATHSKTGGALSRSPRPRIAVRARCLDDGDTVPKLAGIVMVRKRLHRSLLGLAAIGFGQCFRRIGDENT